jgi:CII-binding regulator of phage lambda lysogenization HflD
VTQKILAFCLKHWKEIGLVLLLLVVFAKSRYDMQNILSAHEVSEQSLKNQIETLQTIHEQELRLRDEALERYRRDLEELEYRYQKQQEEIDNLTKAEKEAIIREFEENKSLIIERFEEAYGLRYVD